MNKLITAAIALTTLVAATAFFFSGSPSAYAITDTFTASGSWVAPANVFSVDVEAWGAGGNGGSRSGSNGNACGGGGGAYSKKLSIVVVPGNSYTVSVGATSGADSFFIDTATVLAKGGTNGAGNCQGSSAGGQAASGVGDIKYSGGTGAGTASGAGTGGGGGGAGDANDGGDGTTASCASGGGVGGTGGAVGGGNGGNGRGICSSGVGSPGDVRGGAGGGASRSGSGSFSGGAGGRGEVRITYTESVPALPADTIILE